MFLQKTNIFLTIGVLFFSCLLIFVLYSMSDKPNNDKNGFVRPIEKNKVSLLAEMELKYGGYHISGATKNLIYLGNNSPIPHVLVTDYTLTDTHNIQITAPYKFGWRVMHLAIDSPHISLIDGITPLILHSTFSFAQTIRHQLNNLNFNSYVPISPSSFIFRIYDTVVKQNILIKENMDSFTLKRARKTLEKQIDGIFCTDGMLLYNSHAEQLIYVYYYRNQFICLDTNLNILYKNRTIDTVSKAKIQVDTIKSENNFTLSTPPLFVNKKSCMNENWLFVNSALKGDNETIKIFNSKEAIDVYSLKDGRFHFSFYLPKYNDSKAAISEFKVFDSTIVVLYNSSYLRVFKLRF